MAMLLRKMLPDIWGTHFKTKKKTTLSIDILFTGASVNGLGASLIAYIT